MRSSVEEAAIKMQELVKSNIAQRLNEANEAETRLLLIDRVLNLLGWPPEEYNPEKRTSTGGYTDYLLSVDGQPRLIVEAKRFGLVPRMPRQLQNAQYQNSYLYNSCGPEIHALLDQCRMYCSDTGVPYAIATTGDIWIVLLGQSVGVEWGKLRSSVFYSLEDIVNRFNHFYGLVARECVKNNSLEEDFGSRVLVKPSIAIRPRSTIEEMIRAEQVPYRRGIDSFFEAFMGDITKPGKADMLDYCYVENRETVEFSRELRELLEYDAVLDEQDEPIPSVDEEELQNEIDHQWSTGNPRTILLVGRIGSGKSTFVHKFVRDQVSLDKESENSNRAKNICVVVDLINRVGRHLGDSQDEEQYLSDAVLKQLFDKFRDKFDPYELTVLRRCFQKEAEQYRSRHPNLYERRQEEYLIKEEEFLNGLCEDRYRHLVGYARFIRSKKFKIWVVFDNIDQGTYSYQEFIYNFAHRLSSESTCVTLITLREDTFLEAQDAGFLNVRSSDHVFRITPPELRQLIARRRKYVDYVIDHDDLPKVLSSHKRLVLLLNWHIKTLFLGENDALRKMLSSLSLSNIRFSLQLIEDYYTSYHSLFHVHYRKYSQTEELPSDAEVDVSDEFTHFLQALMLKNDWSYDERDSEIFNLFAVDSEEQSSHFLALAVLAYLSREQRPTKNGVKLEFLVKDLILFGYQRHHIEGVISRLLQTSIVVSPRVPVGMFRKADIPDLKSDTRINLSAKGYYYLNHLASNAYYQTRSAEDTIWYDEERATIYIKALKESLEAQDAYTSQDYLLATDAGNVFLQYLRRAWLQEHERGRAHLRSERARIVTSIIEQKLFGSQITQSVYISGDETAFESEPSPLNDTSSTQLAFKALHAERIKSNSQLSLLSNTMPDYAKTFREAVDSVGPMPSNKKLRKSSYVIKVLWAMEVAFRCGITTPLRASDIAKIINEYGDGDVAAPNVAKFFRNQKRTGEYVHLWKERPAGSYTINRAGRDLLLSEITSALDIEDHADASN